MAYLRRAHARGVFDPHPKFEAIYPHIAANGDAPGSALFATADDIIEWVEIRASLATGESDPADNGCVEEAR